MGVQLAWRYLVDFMNPGQQFIFGPACTQAINFGAVAGPQNGNFLHAFKSHQLPDALGVAGAVNGHFLPDVYRCSVMADAKG
jgi:hypothetical protein